MKFSFLTKKVEHSDFASRTVVAATIATATVAATLVLWKLTDLLPLVFATILVALAWRGGAQRVAARLGLSQGLSLGVVALTLVASVVLGLMLFGGQLVRQYDEIGLDIPDAIALIGRGVEAHPWGHFVEKFLVNVDFTKAAAPVARAACCTPRVLRQWPRVPEFSPSSVPPILLQIQSVMLLQSSRLRLRRNGPTWRGFWISPAPFCANGCSSNSMSSP